MYFAQQHIFTQWGHTVPITATPHYKFLGGDTQAYVEYLKTSWQFYDPEYTPEKLEKRVLDYYTLKLSVESRGIGTPITTFVRPNGDTMVLDGNHRAAIGTYLDIDIPQNQLDLHTAIKRIVAVPDERWGSQVRGMPYQGIYAPNGEWVVAGRRLDLQHRNVLIKPEDIRGQNIIDIGCNYGNALMLTQGAKSLTGTDVDPKILTAAVRLAVVFQKDIAYKIWNVNTVPDNLGKYDTAFVFSIDAHLTTLTNLVAFIKHNVKRIVYYETHVGHAFPQDIKSIFSSVQMLGKVGDRNFYRCLK